MGRFFEKEANLKFALATTNCNNFHFEECWYPFAKLRKVKNVGARRVATQGQKGGPRVAKGTKGTRGTQGRFDALDTPASIPVK